MRLGILFLTGLVLAEHFTNYGALIQAIGFDLHISTGQVGLLSTALFIGVGVAYPLGGWLSDRYGPRRILIGSLLCIGNAGMFITLIPTFTWMLFCRGIVGIGIGIAIVAGSQAAACGQKAAVGQGLFGGASQVGAALGVMLTPFLQSMGGWRFALDCWGFPAFVVCALWVLHTEEPFLRQATRFPRIDHALRMPLIWLLGVVLLGTLGLGQAMAPWLPLLLVDSSRVSLFFGAALTAIVLLVGACVRFLGGVLVAHIRPVRLMQGATLLICLGMGLLIVPFLWVKILGSLLLVGGTCLPFAAIFGEANSVGETTSLGAGIAQGTISMISAPGAALGPAAIGFIEQHSSFPVTLLPVALLGVAACMAAFLYAGQTSHVVDPDTGLFFSPRKEHRR